MKFIEYEIDDILIECYLNYCLQAGVSNVAQSLKKY